MKARTLQYLICTLLCGCSISATMAQKVANTDTPRQNRNLAIQMYNEGNYAGCIDLMTHYRKHTSDVADLSTVDYYIAAAAYAAGNPTACTLLDGYAKNYPQSPYTEQVRLLSAHTCFNNKEYNNAISQYKEINIDKLTPDNQADLFLHLGMAYVAIGKNEAAKPCFEAITIVGGSKKKAAQYHNAHLHYVEGDYKTAGEGFALLTDDKIYAREASAMLTQSLFAQEEYKKTIEEGNSYIQKYTTDSTYYEIVRILGESYYHNKEYDNTIKHLNNYIANTSSPCNNSLYILGMALYNKGDYTEAVTALSKVTDSKDDLGQSAYLYIGHCYLRLNDRTNAAMAFEMASHDKFDLKVQENALYNYAMVLHDATFSPFAESVTIFEKFLNLFPDSPHADTVNDYLVDVYMTTRNYETALQSINKIKQPDAKILNAKQRILYRLGTEAFANNDLTAAANFFSQSIQIGKYDIEARANSYLWLGECMYRKGDYQKAVASGQKYVQNTTEINPQVYYNNGYAYFKQHNFAEAISQFEQFVKAALRNETELPRIADAYTRRADCLYAQRNYTDAQTFYNEAYQLYPTTGDYALYQKGYMAGLLRRHLEKVTIMQQLVKEYPQSDYTDDALLEEGLSLVILKNNQAIECFNTLLNNFSDKETARKAGLQLAMVYYNDKQPAKAIDTYKRVIADYPGSDEARLALQDLKAVYIAQNDVDSYAVYLNTLDRDVKTEVSELDSLSFLVAEREFLKRPDTKSASQLEQYLKKYPNGAYTLQAHNYLALYHYDRKDYNKARRELNIVLQQPESPYAEEALIRIADIHERHKEYPDALLRYQQLERQASTKESRTNARLGIMRMAQKVGDNTQVITITEKLLGDATLSPEHIRNARAVRAECFIALNDSVHAADEWKILAQDPRTEVGAKSAYLLAQYFLDKGNDTQAEETVNKLIENGTSHQYWLARCFIVLSDVYAGRNDMFKAKQYLLSLQNNYKADDDIKERVAVRLEKIQSVTTVNTAQ